MIQCLFSTTGKEVILLDKYLFDIIDALDDVGFLHLFLDDVGVDENGQMLGQRLLHQRCGQGRQVGQVPEQLKYLSRYGAD